MSRKKEQLWTLLRGEACQVFLFNEIAVNVAWAAIPVHLTGSALTEMVTSAATGCVDHSAMNSSVSAALAQLHAISAVDGIITADLAVNAAWNSGLAVSLRAMHLQV
jgi:hypothetical protein